MTASISLSCQEHGPYHSLVWYEPDEAKWYTRCDQCPTDAGATELRSNGQVRAVARNYPVTTASRVGTKGVKPPVEGDP